MDNSLHNSSSKEEIEDESNIITLDEFIEEETRLETDANAVLGPSDDKNCTYSQGYINRQALYACRTCKSETEDAKVAGVCLACTYHCHEGHDLVELYTKRNFRCDCGNSRFKDKKCNLEPVKDPENSGNHYNHNFEGFYCTCKRPYPDLEDTQPDEMIQCIICEDWYHTGHLHAEVPPEENYAEMICGDCTERLSFLKKYLGYSVTKVTKEDNIAVDVIANGENKTVGDKDITNSESGPVTNGEKATDVAMETASFDSGPFINGESTSSEAMETNSTTNTNGQRTEESKAEMKSEEVTNRDASSPVKASDQKDEATVSSSDKCEAVVTAKGCLLESMEVVKQECKGATFWPHNFRSLLCTCSSCKDMYERLGVSYITDGGDTAQSYEEKATAPNPDSKHSMDKMLSMLSNIGMDRFTQAEAILNYNELKSNLRDYLSKFVENKKVVREEDIREFFTQLNAKKRQKLDLPYTCR